jgi:Lrp/AsnC family leucine-responsive transcriptional regulator
MTELSRADRQILEILQRDGRISNVELANRIGMSPSPCLRRVRDLEESGIIERYVAIVDRAKVGIGLVAHVELKVPQLTATGTLHERLRDAINKEPSVIGCFMTTGRFDFLLKVVARDMDEFSQLALTRLLRLPGVHDMESSFVLNVVKDTTSVPIDPPSPTRSDKSRRRD